jgi:hypothetical protein
LIKFYLDFSSCEFDEKVPNVFSSDKNSKMMRNSNIRKEIRGENLIQKFDSEENIEMTKNLKNIGKNKDVEIQKYYNDEIKELMVESSDGDFETDEMMVGDHNREASEVSTAICHYSYNQIKLQTDILCNTTYGLN